MYCKRCGVEIDNDVVFCNKCGERITVSIESGWNGNNNLHESHGTVKNTFQNKSLKKSKKLLIIVPACIAVCVAIAVCLWFFVFGKNASNLVSFYSLAEHTVINYNKTSDMADKTENIFFYREVWEERSYDENGNLVVYRDSWGYSPTIFTYDVHGRLNGEYRSGYKVGYFYSEETGQIERAYYDNQYTGVSYVVDYTYNNQDNSVDLNFTTEDTAVSYDSTIITHITYSYLENGLINEVNIESHDEIGAYKKNEIYEYNDRGAVVKITIETQSIYTFDENDSQEKILSENIPPEDSVSTEYKYDYDEEGNLISTEYSHSSVEKWKNGDQVSSSTYLVNMQYENGLCVRATYNQETTDGEYECEYEYEYEYEYDEDGEFLAESRFDSNSEEEPYRHYQWERSD